MPCLGVRLECWGEGSSGPQAMADGLLTSLVVCHGATCNQTVMSGRKLARLVDFAGFSFAVDRICCVLARSFPMRNWCGGAPAFGRQPASKRFSNLAQARGTIRV